ncbi:MAG: hypothetical protein Q7V01_04260 [Vicinamibacterales bacterium]|nr:hypothetical protein [Vicinamibacterales bacterium]
MTRRAFVLVLLAWLVGLTGARDFLHNHGGLTERPDCPACRVAGATGVTTSTPAALSASPELVAVGIVPNPRTLDYVSGFVCLDPPPRSPPVSF